MEHVDLLEVQDEMFDYILQRASFGSSDYQALLNFVDSYRGLTKDQFDMVQRDLLVDTNQIPEFIEPGRRCVIGRVESQEAKIDDFGPYIWVRLRQPNGHIVEFRRPKQERWTDGDVIQVVVTIEPMSLTSAVGHKPRRVQTGTTKEALARRSSGPLFLHEVARIEDSIE